MKYRMYRSAHTVLTGLTTPSRHSLAMISLVAFGVPQRIIWGGYFLLVSMVVAAGDSLYTAYLYPVIAPIVALEICSWRKLRSFYLSGVAVVIYLTLVSYLSINWFSANPEGFLVVGHLLSLPGLVIGAIALSLQDRPTYGPAASILLGATGASIGFLLAQGVVCNTVMYCGALSPAFK
ncbi:hypothetical protein [Azonexus hydrophilus]|uniref:Uncharacterized protein n=1 Tax=Azonexus hydrophilus TaxID=418702 RepID=A0ABZ2XE43_9RHOO|nr:hypothetical protein [Azonexus hydrophilus]MBS4017781.1 hypothetical protein [Dechloromonas sp.]